MEKKTRDIAQNNTILQTKLEVPNLATKVLRRTRLTSLIGKPGERILTVISAPAGYGKTTLLGEWLSTSATHNQRAAWLTLDLFDNAPFRFWFYLIAAIRNIFPTLKYRADSMLSGHDSQNYSWLDLLINEINTLPFYLNIILDDFHVIKDQAIIEGLSYLIEYQPKNLHIIIASRVRPDIPLARLRTQGRLVEITAEDLAFSFEETCSYLNDSIIRKLSSNEIVNIFENTEGWIAGLKMTAITYQSGGKEDNSFFEVIQNSQAFREYFSEEVLGKLGPELQNFVIKTSLLTEFSSELCDFLFESSNSQSLIDQIYENNLFIETIDNQNIWFRYHPLFVLSLNHQLQKREPSLIIEIHQKALNWFIEKGYPEKAVIHALQSGQEEKAAEIIDSLALQAAIDFDLIKLVHWINAIPENLTNFKPRLGVYNALACFLLGQYDITRTRLQQTEHILLDLKLIHEDPTEYDILTWEIAVIRTGIEIMAGDIEKGYREISLLLSDKTKEDNYIYAMFTHFKARSLEKMGRLSEALEVYEAACNYGLAKNYHIGHFHSRIGITQVLLGQGNIIKAKQECERIVDFLVERKLESATYNMALSLQLEIELQLNNMNKADRLAEIVLANFENTISSESVLYNHVERCVYLANYLVRKRDLKNARLYFERALSCHRDYTLPGAALSGVIVDTFLRLVQAEACENDLAEWHQVVIEFLDEESLSTPMGKIALATARYNQKAYTQAISILSDLVVELRKSENVGYTLQALILYALVFYQSGETENAFSLLGETLEIAAENGAIRVFIEQGEPLQHLVEAYTNTTKGVSFMLKQPGFIEKLLQLLDQECKNRSDRLHRDEPMMTAIHLLKEPLSDREFEIVNMLIAGKTGKEISDLLMISINTTKTHIQSIYRKFGIHSQRMLITKAKELGLLK